MPQADQNATSTSTQTTDKTMKSTTTTSDQNATTTDQDANNTNGKKLPQTATPLPLLALLGMGSLTSGIVARRKK